MGSDSSHPHRSVSRSVKLKGLLMSPSPSRPPSLLSLVLTPLDRKRSTKVTHSEKCPLHGTAEDGTTGENIVKGDQDVQGAWNKHPIIWLFCPQLWWSSGLEEKGQSSNFSEGKAVYAHDAEWNVSLSLSLLLPRSMTDCDTRHGHGRVAGRSLGRSRPRHEAQPRLDFWGRIRCSGQGPRILVWDQIS